METSSRLDSHTSRSVACCRWKPLHIQLLGTVQGMDSKFCMIDDGLWIRTYDSYPAWRVGAFIYIPLGFDSQRRWFNGGYLLLVADSAPNSCKDCSETGIRSSNNRSPRMNVMDDERSMICTILIPRWLIHPFHDRSWLLGLKTPFCPNCPCIPISH